MSRHATRPHQHSAGPARTSPVCERRPLACACERGQTANEMLMIMGLLTAMLIMVTNIVLPTMSFIVERLVKHMIVYLSSPAPP